MQIAKKCVKCGEVKSLDDYYPDRTQDDGYKNSCRKCVRAAQAEYRRRIRETPMPEPGNPGARVPGYAEPPAEKPQPKGKHERFEVEKERLETEGLPKPQLVDLDQAHPVLDGLPDPVVRERARGFLAVLLEGGLHKQAMKEADFSWNQWQNIMNHNEGMRALYMLCRDIGEEYRKIVRLDSAHERAVDGIDDPIYSAGGKYLGTRKLYSDRLLELLIKADDPDRFRDKPADSSEGIVIQISPGFDRAQLREEFGTKDAPAAVDAEFTVLERNTREKEE